MKIPLILISGLLSNEKVWSHQVATLVEVATIKVVSPTGDTPSKMVEEVLKEAPNQFALAGHSMGGWLALEIMRIAGDRVMKLCLLNSTANSDTSIKRHRRKEMIKRVEQGSFSSLVDELVEVFVFNQKVKREVHKMFLEVGGEVFIRQEQSMLQREECESILPKIKCPTLIVHALNDQVFTLEDQQKLVDNIPQSQLSIIKNCGHMSPMESKEEVSSLLYKWLVKESLNEKMVSR